MLSSNVYRNVYVYVYVYLPPPPDSQFVMTGRIGETLRAAPTGYLSIVSFVNARKFGCERADGYTFDTFARSNVDPAAKPDHHRQCSTSLTLRREPKRLANGCVKAIAVQPDSDWYGNDKRNGQQRSHTRGHAITRCLGPNARLAIATRCSVHRSVRVVQSDDRRSARPAKRRSGSYTDMRKLSGPDHVSPVVQVATRQQETHGRNRRSCVSPTGTRRVGNRHRQTPSTTGTTTADGQTQHVSLSRAHCPMAAPLSDEHRASGVTGTEGHDGPLTAQPLDSHAHPSGGVSPVSSGGQATGPSRAVTGSAAPQRITWPTDSRRRRPQQTRWPPAANGDTGHLLGLPANLTGTVSEPDQRRPGGVGRPANASSLLLGSSVFRCLVAAKHLKMGLRPAQMHRFAPVDSRAGTVELLRTPSPQVRPVFWVTTHDAGAVNSLHQPANNRKGHAMSYESRNEVRAYLREQIKGYTDAVVAQALRLVAQDIHPQADGKVPQMPQTRWDAMEVIAVEAMERFSDRTPNTLDDAFISGLAAHTWGALHTGWVSHTQEVRAWATARGELLANDTAATLARADAIARMYAQPTDVIQADQHSVADPLADTVTVAGGYRWFGDGRAPEPA